MIAALAWLASMTKGVPLTRDFPARTWPFTVQNRGPPK